MIETSASTCDHWSNRFLHRTALFRQIRLITKHNNESKTQIAKTYAKHVRCVSIKEITIRDVS